jgi:hypothetical protein
VRLLPASIDNPLTNEDVLNREKVLLALERKQAQFRSHAAAARQQAEMVQDALAAFTQLDYAAVQAQIETLGLPFPGARPTAELDHATALRLPFAHQWEHHQAARAWALATLTDRPVIAVDSSQITPTKDYSLAVGAVQVGWFINYHAANGRYIKDVEFEVLGPQELAGEENGSDDPFPNWRVNLARFQRECDRLIRLMQQHAAAPASLRPLCFFDGSFIISFAGQMHADRARDYIRSVTDLLECSEETRVPLVGFVDTSYSHDLVRLVENLIKPPAPLILSDAALLAPSLAAWGDRSPFFLCARDDALARDGRGAFYDRVAFTYVHLVQDRPPARLECPAWMLEEGIGEGIVDLVRAECVVGTGYPYAIETADALAVITQEDRRRFYALLQQFTTRHGLAFTQARKAASKSQRR